MGLLSGLGKLVGLAAPIAGFVLGGPAGAVIGGSIGGAISGGLAENEQAAFKRRMALQNKRIADQLAQDAIDRGHEEVGRAQQRTRQVLGRQRNALAASGVVLDYGSASDLADATRAAGKADAMTIRANAEREALRFRAEGANYATEAKLQRATGRNALVSSLIGGATDVSSKWYQFNKEGAFSNA